MRREFLVTAETKSSLLGVCGMFAVAAEKCHLSTKPIPCAIPPYYQKDHDPDDYEGGNRYEEDHPMDTCFTALLFWLSKYRSDAVTTHHNGSNGDDNTSDRGNKAYPEHAY